MPKRFAPLSIRLDPETTERLELAAEQTGITKHALAQMAVKAAVEAIAQNNYKLVVPIRFDVTHIPESVREGKNEPQAHNEGMTVRGHQHKNPKTKR